MASTVTRKNTSFILAVCFSAFLAAAVATSASAQPQFIVDQEHTGVFGAGASYNLSVYDIAQSFVPQHPLLGGIELEVLCCNAQGDATIRLDIRQGAPGGTLVGSSESLVPDGTGSSGGFGDGVLDGHFWTFSPELVLTPGITYVIELVLVSGTDASSGFSTLGNYGPGEGFRDGSPQQGDVPFRTGHFAPSAQLYFSEAVFKTVERVDFDGANRELLVSAPTSGAVNGMTVDPVGGYIYWVECCGGLGSKVMRANINGGTGVSIVAGATMAFPQRIVADPANQHIYWSDSTAGVIYRADSDGTGLTALLGPDTQYSPVGLAIDPLGGKLYWTENAGTHEGIHRMDLTSSTQEALLLVSNGDDIAQVEGISVDWNDGRMYWTDIGLNEIRRADLDGSNVEVIADFVSHGVVNPIGIAVDPLGERVYYNDSAHDTITRMELTGSNPVDIVTTGLSFARGMDLVPTYSVPEPNGLLGLGACMALLACLERRR